MISPEGDLLQVLDCHGRDGSSLLHNGRDEGRYGHEALEVVVTAVREGNVIHSCGHDQWSRV